ncbi:MAG: cytochrome c [Gammaproteobacteria bacterium]
MRQTHVYLVILFSALCFNVQAEGDPEAGKTKSQACAACHSADGNSVMPDWPKLAGQGAKYLIQQLNAFKSGDRENPLMTAPTASLSDQDIADLAAYFSSQKVVIGAADPALVEAGESLYRGGDAEKGIPACMACHGPSGAGNSAAAYPAVQGQHAAYTATQLKAFRSGERKTDANNVMRDIADRMKDNDIESVSAYISGLH